MNHPGLCAGFVEAGPRLVAAAPHRCLLGKIVALRTSGARDFLRHVRVSVQRRIGNRVRVSLVTLGTRGDAQPIVVLARELERRGHTTVLGVPPNLLDFVARAGLHGMTI